MRLWGKVVSGSLLVFAAVFAGVGLFVPEARAVCLVAAAACAAVALLGVPLVVRAFMSIAGDEDVLEHGLAERATILTIEPTGWRYNRERLSGSACECKPTESRSRSGKPSAPTCSVGLHLARS